MACKQTCCSFSQATQADPSSHFPVRELFLVDSALLPTSRNHPRITDRPYLPSSSLVACQLNWFRFPTAPSVPRFSSFLHLHLHVHNRNYQSESHLISPHRQNRILDMLSFSASSSFLRTTSSPSSSRIQRSKIFQLHCLSKRRFKEAQGC